ncbi:MAG: methylated-DNA--[protein]-cysteine S-methyltransferase [Verrucomicrobiales bacterium]|nr:methylated-DNA--[protein]-cysteine S-methyltransferase [Verrucomicrobiales bacterium]
MRGLRFPSSDAPAPPPDPVPSGVPEAWLAQARVALHEALTQGGRSPLPPLDLSSGTEFQREVWGYLLTIPRGETRSYGEVAAALGRPKATQATGQACGANPIPVLIPCHRVLAAGSRLGGFSGGLEWKRRLLGLERGRDFPFLALEPSVIHAGLCVGCPDSPSRSAGSR